MNQRFVSIKNLSQNCCLCTIAFSIEEFDTKHYTAMEEPMFSSILKKRRIELRTYELLS